MALYGVVVTQYFITHLSNLSAEEVKASHHFHIIIFFFPERCPNQHFWRQLSREDRHHHWTNRHHFQGFCNDCLQIWGGAFRLDSISQKMRPAHCSCAADCSTDEVWLAVHFPFGFLHTCLPGDQWFSITKCYLLLYYLWYLVWHVFYFELAEEIKKNRPLTVLFIEH